MTTVDDMFIKDPCPKCGSKMFRIPCKCPFRRKGWATCAKCINPKCAFQKGLQKRKFGLRAIDRFSKRGL